MRLASDLAFALAAGVLFLAVLALNTSLNGKRLDDRIKAAKDAHVFPVLGAWLIFVAVVLRLW